MLTALTGLRHVDEDEKALAGIPMLADRVKYHTKKLWGIKQTSGDYGVTAYKAKHPEAKAVLIKSTVFAFPSKPAGYDDALCRIVDSWFDSDVALAESNRTSVGRLNERLQSQLDPDRHFSVPLSSGRLTKIAAVFASRGAHIDTSKATSMSAIRASVKVAKRSRAEGRPFGEVGRIVDNRLLLNGSSFAVMQHHGHECIKITLGNGRHWLRLDVANAFVTAAGLTSGAAAMTIPDILTDVVIPESVPATGERPLSHQTMVPDVKNRACDPLAGDGAIQSFEELIPDVRHSLGDRIAGLRSAMPSHFTAFLPDLDTDPLAFSTS